MLQMKLFKLMFTKLTQSSIFLFFFFNLHYIIDFITLPNVSFANDIRLVIQLIFPDKISPENPASFFFSGSAVHVLSTQQKTLRSLRRSNESIMNTRSLQIDFGLTLL